MTAQDLIAVWEAGLLVIGLIIGCFYLRADYEVDSFRQKIFQVRDEMFDYASGGNIPYSDPAYVQLRDLANGLIRFAHRLTLLRMGIMFVLHRLLGLREPTSFATDMERNISSIESPEVQAKMRQFHQKLGLLVVWQIVKSSVILWPLIAFFAIKHILKQARVQTLLAHLAIEETAESARMQKAVPWIEEQAITCP